MEGLNEQPQKEEIEQSQENSEAMMAAKEKLARLMKDDFREFAVRLMNIDEYRWRLDSRETYGDRECVSFVGDDKAPTFKQWLDNSSEDWWKVIWETDWPMSGRGYMRYNLLIEKLKEAHEKVIAEKNNDSGDEKNINAKTIETFMGIIDPNPEEKPEGEVFEKDERYIEIFKVFLELKERYRGLQARLIYEKKN